MGSLHIREATQNDIAPIAMLHILLVKEMALLAQEMEFGGPDIPETEQLRQLYHERLEDEDSVILLAEEQNETLGYLSAVIEQNSDDLMPAPFITIEFVATSPAARGRGVASALVTQVEQIAVTRGIHHADILVWENNAAARGLYDKLGYVSLERRMGKRLT